MNNLENELAQLLNHYNEERYSNTPDFILARYMIAALAAYNAAVRKRDDFYGINPKPGWEKT